MKQLSFLIFFLVSYVTFSQISGLRTGVGNTGQTRNLDSISNEITVKLNGTTKYTDYKVISHKNDTHNQGLTFTNLAYDYNNLSLYPDIGNRAKQFLYMNVEDIDYYEVPTPTSEILYRTGLEQGQVLDALFTLNFSKRLNASIAYKGLRSLGKYRQSLVSNGNFRTTLSYRTPKDRYQLRLHTTFQDFWNQESGGLPEESIINFESNDEDFREREKIIKYFLVKILPIKKISVI